MTEPVTNDPLDYRALGERAFQRGYWQGFDEGQQSARTTGLLLGMGIAVGSGIIYALLRLVIIQLL